MPVHNTDPGFLEQAIDSILNQTYPHFELVIYDDGSTLEETIRTLDCYAERDARVRVIHVKENVGVIKARNRLMAEATNDLCAFMDSDDISSPFRFERQIEFFRRHPDVGVCGTWFRTFPTEITVCPVTTPGYLDFLREDCLGNPTVMFNKRMMESFGLSFDVNLKASEDYEIYSRAVRYMKMANIPEVLLEYRVREDSLSHSNLDFQRESDYIIHERMLDFLSRGHYRVDVKRMMSRYGPGFGLPRRIRIPLSKSRRIKAFFRRPLVDHLDGDLGEQMFRYAYGCAMAEELGRRVRFVLPKEGDILKMLRKKPWPAGFPDRLFGIKKGPSGSPREVYERNKDLFMRLRPFFELAFAPPGFSNEDTFCQTALMDIRLSDNPVFIHITKDFPASYYEKAAAYMVSHLKEPHFFVFGDNIPETMDALRAHSTHVEWFGSSGEEWKDMALMMQCGHAIVTDTAFSLMPAWIGRAKTGIVLTPYDTALMTAETGR